MPVLDFRTIGRPSMTQKATAPIRAAFLLLWALASATFLGGCTPHLAGTNDAALEYEASLQGMAGRTADHAEGLAAFVAKRAPRFSGS